MTSTATTTIPMIHRIGFSFDAGGCLAWRLASWRSSRGEDAPTADVMQSPAGLGTWHQLGSEAPTRPVAAHHAGTPVGRLAERRKAGDGHRRPVPAGSSGDSGGGP